MGGELRPDRGLALFTDGSCWHKDRRGGWAWVAIDAYDGEVSGSGSEADTTISRMELFAAIHGLTWLGDAYGSCEVLIYSDSEYVVLGASRPERARLVNRDHWARLDEAVGWHEYVEWKHVRGHDGSRYNELADELAREARLRGTP